MPLLKGSSREIIDENIREMRHAGHPEAQAIAAAFRQARESKGGTSRPPARRPVRRPKQ